MTPVNKPKQTRTPVAAGIIEYFKTHPNQVTTLDELERELGGLRRSIASSVNTMIDRNTLPGLEWRGKGVYCFCTDGSTTTPVPPQAPALLGGAGFRRHQRDVLAQRSSDFVQACL